MSTTKCRVIFRPIREGMGMATRSLVLAGSRGSAVFLFSLLFLGLAAIGCSDDNEDQAASQSGIEPWSGDSVAGTLLGAVRGFEDRSDTWLWKAIPFAKPPVGPLRWKAPQDPDPWTGTREVSEFCSPCTQYFTFGDFVVGSEDCLYLNIWRPRSAEQNLPVYFWIHGGGNSVGAAAVGEDYSGANLAARSNLVVVTVNYRLGPLGWFTHPALRKGEPGTERDDSGNYGTLDLIQALSWVRENIEAFGGDPARVLIAGESAGAMNVLSLLVSPVATDLFQRAMAESGGPFSSQVEEGEASARDAILHLLVRDGTAADLTEAEVLLGGMTPPEIEAYLRSKPGEELLQGYEPSFGGMINSLPAVFEDGVVIPAGGFSSLQAGTYPNKVPVILGSNQEELKLFFFADPSFSGRDDLYQIVTSYGSDFWKASGVDGVARALRSHADQPDVYAYHFLWGAGGERGESMIPDPWGFILGSFHTLEIPFFFGNDTVDVLLQLLVFTEENRPGREALSSAMMAYAARFVATGDPNEAGSGLPRWEPWSNDPDMPKCILLDVDADQALDIRMSEAEFTESGVLEGMAADVDEPLYSEALSYLGW
jgi:para-nitrobenzyl esterase